VSYYISENLIPQLKLFITDIGFEYIALAVYSEEKAQGTHNNALTTGRYQNNALTTGHYQNVALNTG